MCYLSPSSSSKRALKSHDEDAVVMSARRDCVAERLSRFCCVTELFTMNRHAMYCTDILYPVAVYDETVLFDTMNEYIDRRNRFVFVLFFWNCS